jgi:hypothetical protein
VSTSGAHTATAASPTFTPHQAGTWCFRADYSGDSNYNASSDGASGECFTVRQATPSVTSTPTSAVTTLAAGDTDQAKVTGNGGGGSPTGTVSFFVCGPLSGASGCPSNGNPVGSAVPLTASSGDSASATSPTFVATSPGIYCFRAEYSGDANYAAAKSGGSSGECFTVSAAGAPSATIASPALGSIYRVGQLVLASYSCAEGTGGPGLESCSGTVPNGSPINTSTRGPHSFVVVARSHDGLTTPALATYTVAGPPFVSISSPANGATYTRGENVGVSFTCADDQFGPGLASCVGPPAVDTANTGSFPFTVRARSLDGQTMTETVTFNVVLPSNRFTVSHLRHRNGRVNFQVTVPSAGTLDVVETAPRTELLRPKRGRLVYARLHRTLVTGGVKQVTIGPNSLGRFLLHHHRLPVRLRLVITYTPTNGVPASTRFNTVRMTR